MQFRRIYSVIGLILALFPAAFTQEADFRAGTRLVEVSVVAADEQGKPVRDLKKEDFTLIEDGKPQQISHFFTSAMLAAGGPPPKLPQGIYSNRPELLPHAPRTVSAIVIDYLNTPWAAQTATREQLLSVLRKLGDNDVVALYTMGSTLSILHDYTSDRKSLEAQLQKSPGLLPRSRNENEIISNSAVRWERAFNEGRAQAENSFRASIQRGKTLLTLHSLSLVARHLAGIPGRKNIIFMSGGFPLSILPGNTTTPTMIMSEARGIRVDNMPSPERALVSGEASLFLDSMEKVLRTISDAGVAIYGVDVNGLVVPMVDADTDRPSNLSNAALASYSPVPDAHASLVELSSRTGGVSTLRSNNIEGAVNQVLDDARYAYTLAYYTANDRFDGKFRKIELKCSRGGLKLRYRNGYTAAESSAAAVSAKSDLQEALTSPVTQNAVLLTAQLQPAGDQFNLALQVEPRQLALRESGGQWSGALDVLLYQRTPEGKMKGQQISLPLKLDANSYRTVMQKGLVFRKSLERDKNARWLRVVVRDSNNGATGSLDIPLV